MELFMKKILSLLLAVALLASFGTSALAGGGAVAAANSAVDESLADITLKVKNTSPLS